MLNNIKIMVINKQVPVWFTEKDVAEFIKLKEYGMNCKFAHFVRSAYYREVSKLNAELMRLQRKPFIKEVE